MKLTTDPTPAILQRFAYNYDAAANRTSEQIDDALLSATHNTRNELVSQQPGGAVMFVGSVNEAATVTVATRPMTVAADNSFRGTAAVPSGTSVVSVAATDVSGNTATKSYQISQSGSSKTLTYDANGNLTSDETRTFEWDAENRLVAVNIGTHRSEFSYDGLDRRVRIFEKENGATARDAQLIWDGTAIAEERLSTGEVTRFFADGESHNGIARYLTRDHLGSIREVTDAAGTVVTRNDYDTYGRLTRIGGTEDSRFGFTGHMAHAPSGLTLAQYRAYDPNLGRWISDDPAGFLDGPNLYQYVGNNALNWSDPTGLCADDSDSTGSGPPPRRTPARGNPNTTVRYPAPGGGYTDRTYGPDGRATKDIDKGHDHNNTGDPHAHDWDWSKDSPRQPGRPLTPEEAAALATIGTVLYWIVSEGSRIVFPIRNLVPVP